MSIPTESDWGDHTDDLDIEYARRQFAGKSIEEVHEYFVTSHHMACEDMYYMPDTPFRYYFNAFVEYFQQSGDQDSDAGNAVIRLLDLTKSTLSSDPERILPILPAILPRLHQIVSNQDAYDAPADIYGSFPEMFEGIRALAGRHGIYVNLPDPDVSPDA